MAGKLAFSLMAGAVASTIESGHETNTTMYHINPFWAGVVPENEDTGDLQGILYFFLDTLFLPIECAEGGGMSGFDCSNPERTDPDMVHTYVDMVHDDRTTGYSLCNLCTDATDKVSHKPCTIGEYQCNCGSFGSGCDKTKLGVEDIPGGGGSSRRRTGPPSPTPPPSPFPDWGRRRRSTSTMEDVEPEAQAQRCVEGKEWSCYKNRLGQKTGGKWYSPLAEGHCDDTTEGTCGWRVRNMFTVNDTCVRESVYTAVESQGPDCFADCAVPRNVSSACWINCFFGTMMGSSAGSPNGVWDPQTDGMNFSDVEQGYLNAFKPESEGGCPRIEVNASLASSQVWTV